MSKGLAPTEMLCRITSDEGSIFSKWILLSDEQTALLKEQFLRPNGQQPKLSQRGHQSATTLH